MKIAVLLPGTRVAVTKLDRDPHTGNSGTFAKIDSGELKLIGTVIYNARFASDRYEYEIVLDRSGERPEEIAANRTLVTSGNPARVRTDTRLHVYDNEIVAIPE